jgi:hypothetical protein
MSEVISQESSRIHRGLISEDWERAEYAQGKGKVYEDLFLPLYLTDLGLKSRINRVQSELFDLGIFTFLFPHYLSIELLDARHQHGFFQNE